MKDLRRRGGALVAACGNERQRTPEGRFSRDMSVGLELAFYLKRKNYRPDSNKPC